MRFTRGVMGLVVAGVMVCAGGVRGEEHRYVNSELPWHEAVLDGQGKLLAWYGAEKGRGYDRVCRLAWEFIEHRIPNDAKSGLKVYLVNAVFDAKTYQGTNWQGNPASTFGQFVDSVVAWYPYSGDTEAIGVVRSMLDHQMAHGTSPAGWEWGKVPFATTDKNNPEYGRALRGAPKDFYGGIETDKVGELGIGYVLFYELTGEEKYLEAGIACADALAGHVRAGDETHTPWPYRVEAKTGQAINGEEYGGMVVAPVRLLSEMVRLGRGDVKKYQAARDVAWKWILKYPMQNQQWSGYFEDVGKNLRNVNQASPTMTAYYLLSAADPAALDKHWNGDVGKLIDWVRKRFGRGPYFSAWAIDEQGEPPDYCGCCSRAGLGSDSSRWGAINAMYFERTGDLQAREDAFRSLNYATYFADSEGKVACCGIDYADSYWFDDGYADYIRNFLWAMGAVPEFAPAGEDHLLRSTSVVQSVKYGKKTIAYRTFDADGTEVLRLTYRPGHVTAGKTELKVVTELKEGEEGYTVRELEGGDYVVRVRHRGEREVSVSG